MRIDRTATSDDRVARFIVSVGIPTCGRVASLRRTISSILAGTRLPEEIIVGDQSTNVGVATVLEEASRRSPGVHLRHERVLPEGVSANRNHILAVCRGAFVAFCDDDITVDRRWLEGMLEEWSGRWGGNDVVITGRILPAEEFGDDENVPGVRLSRERHVHRLPPARGDTLYGGHFGAARTVFESLGPRPFDERLGPGARYHGAEDEDFGRRVLAAGIPVVYEPSIVVRHHPVRGSWPRAAYTHSIGAGAMLAKEMLARRQGAVRQLGWSLAIALGKSARALLRRDRGEAWTRVLSAAGIAVGFVRWVTDAIVTRDHRSVP